MSNSIEILIEADNQASKTFEQVTKDADTNVKNIKGIGEKAKKSTEFVGVLANALGGSELGQFAQQLGSITEKTSQFAEVSKTGGAGAMAFKAGLVAAVAVIAFQVGSAIGNAIFQTAKWAEKLKESADRAKELASESAKVNAIRLSDTKEDIELISDPAEKRKALEALFKATQKELIGTENQVKQSKKEVEAWNAAWFKTGNRAAFSVQANAKLEDDKARLKVLQDETLAQQRLLNDRTANNEALKKSNALKSQDEAYLEGLRKELELLTAKDKLGVKAKQSTNSDDAEEKASGLLKQIEAAKTKEEADKLAISTTKDLTKKSDDYIAGLRKEVDLLRAKKEEIAGVQATQNTFGDAAKSEAEKLIKERDMLKEKADTEKKAADQKAQQIQKIADLKQSELDKLAEEQVLLTQGKEAAHAFNLEKQGLSKEDAKSIARQQAVNDKLKAKPETKSNIDTALQASESRLLTRGTDNESQKIAEATQASSLALQSMLAVMLPSLPNLTGINDLRGLMAIIAKNTDNEYAKVGD